MSDTPATALSIPRSAHQFDNIQIRKCGNRSILVHIPASRLCGRKKRHGAQNNFRGINVPTQTNGSVCVCLCAYQSTINTSSACLLFRVLCVSCWDEAKWVRIALQHISYIFAIQCVLESSSRSLFVPRTHNPYLCTCYFAISHPHSHSQSLAHTLFGRKDFKID